MMGHRDRKLNRTGYISYLTYSRLYNNLSVYTNRESCNIHQKQKHFNKFTILKVENRILNKTLNTPVYKGVSSDPVLYRLNQTAPYCTAIVMIIHTALHYS